MGLLEKMKTREHIFLKSLLLNIALLLFCSCFYHCSFESNDDYYMKMISSGAFGEPDIHLVYINSIFGFILKTLYSFNRNVSWYEILQYFLIFLSLITLTYVFFNRCRKCSILFIPFLLLLYISAYTLYVQFQFTKTATILTLAGYTLLAHSLDVNENNRWIVFSCFLIVSGSMMRLYQFLAISLICSPLFFPIIVHDCRDKFGYRKCFRKLLVSGICCVILFTASIIVDRYNYSSDGWRSFLLYNHSSTKLMDEGFPSYEEHRYIYDDLSIDEEDLEMYLRWNYDDPENYDLDTIQKLVDAREKKTISLNSVVSFITSSIAYFFHYRKVLIYTLFLFLMLGISFFNKKKENYAYIILSLVTTLLCMFYCYFIRIDNVFVFRVHSSFLLTASYMVLYFTELPDAPSAGKSSIVLTVILFALFYTFSQFSVWKIVGKDSTTIDRKNILREIYADQEHLYLRCEDNPVFFLEGLFERETELSCSNLLHLGGWITNAPVEWKIKEKYGIKNSYKDVIDNDKIYVLSSSEYEIESVISYIQRNYDNNVKAVLVKEFSGGFRVYKIVSYQ